MLSLRATARALAASRFIAATAVSARALHATRSRFSDKLFVVWFCFLRLT